MTKDTLYDYHIWDSRKINEKIKKPLVDVIITSPPYWNLKNYEVDDQIGFGQKYGEYLHDMTEIFNKCKSVLKETGSLWIVVDSFKKNGNVKMLPFELASKLQDDGWFLQDIIIWQKDKTLPYSSKGKLRNIFEYVLFFTKSKNFNFFVDELREVELKKWWPKYPERYNPKGKVPSRVWDIPIPIQGWGKTWVRHFCPFPPQLIERILLLTTKEDYTVLDPFAGSGSVLAQADVMGRKSIGFDLNSEYRAMYYEKVIPFFKNSWIERKKELDNICQKRKYLEKTIPALRRIKYPMTLYKELVKEYPSIIKELNFFIAQERRRDIIYYMIFDKDVNDMQNSAIEKTRKKNLKKFSIDPIIRILPINKLEEIKTKKLKYLYLNGINNSFSREIDFNKWIKERYEEKYPKEKIPPIVSNIRVKQENHLINL